MAKAKSKPLTPQEKQALQQTATPDTSMQSKMEVFRESDPFFKQVLESLEDYAVFTTDQDGTISSWNSGAEKLFGYAENEIIGQNTDILFIPEDRKKREHVKELENAILNGRATDEKWHLRKDKSRFWASGLMFPLKDSNDQIIGFTKIARDLTLKKTFEAERKLLLEEVELEKKKLANIFENAPAFMAILRGEDHVFEMANSAYYQLIGHRDVIGKTAAEALPEVVEQGFIKILDQVLRTGKPYIGTETLVLLQRRKGAKTEERYVNFVYEAMKDVKGKRIGIVAHGYDVTDQVLARQKIQESEERYRTLFNSIDEGFSVIEVLFDKKNRPIDYRFLETNPIFEKQTGLVNAVGKTARELIPNLEKRWFEMYGKVAMTGESMRFIDGSEAMDRWFNVYANRVGDEKSRKVAIVFNDITKRKKAELALQYQKSLLEAQKEMSPMGILIISPDGKILTYNNRFSEMWKFTQSELETQVDTILLKKAYQQLQNPEQFLTRVEEIYASKERSHEKLIFTDGRIFDRYGSPINDEDGKYYGYVWFFLDITEREQLARQKDDFLGIASHELKTPVTSIKAYGQVLQRVFAKKGDDKAVDQLKKMDTQINKLTSLIADLLDVTKIQSGRLVTHKEEFDFNSLVLETVEEMQRTTDQHTLVLDLAKTKKIFGDRERTGQVIVNLISNAIKYSPHTENIIISSSFDRKKIQLCVQDFGVGIPEDKQEKVFEQFFRVSGDKQHTFPGLGLGLYISSEIIKRQGGRIWVESAIGKGSTFCFSLPIHTSASKNS